MVRTLPFAVAFALVVAAAPVPRPNTVPVPDLTLLFSDNPPDGALRLLGGRRVLAGVEGDLAPGKGTVVVAGFDEFTEHDVTDGRVVATHRPDRALVRWPQNSPDGKVVVFDSIDTLHVWDRAAREPLQKVPVLRDGKDVAQATGRAVSPDGTAVAVGGINGHVRVFDIPKGEWREFDAAHPVPDGAAPNAPPPCIRQVAWTPDGKAVVSSASGEGVRAWDVATGQELWALAPPDVCNGPFAFTPDGKHIVAQSTADDETRVASVWDVATRKRVKVLTGFAPVHVLTFSPDGRLLTDGRQVWDMKAEKVTRVLPASRPPSVVAFSRDGTRLAADRRVFDVATGREIDADRGHAGRVLWLSATPDGERAVTAGTDGFARGGEVTTGKPLGTFGVYGEMVRADLSADGKRVAVGDGDVVTVFDVATGKEVCRAKGHSTVWQIAFSPDGKTLAVTPDGPPRPLFNKSPDVVPDGLAVHLYDAATGKPLRQLAGGDGEFHDRASVAWTPDSTQLVSSVAHPAEAGEKKYTAVLWDVATGERVREFDAGDSAYRSVAISADGKHVVICHPNVRYIELATGKQIWASDAVAFHHVTFDHDGRVYGGGKCLDVKTGKPATDGRKEFTDAYRLHIPPQGRVALTVAEDDSVAVVWKR